MLTKLLSAGLAILLVLLFPSTAFCQYYGEADSAAEALNELGLFNGTGVDSNGTPLFDLDLPPTRHQAVVMLVRLLGKEEEAKNGQWYIPFTDVASWAEPYVGYAYTNGLTLGVSETLYGGENNITSAQYVTFVLRALGYNSGVDFNYTDPWEVSDCIGLTSGNID